MTTFTIKYVGPVASALGVATALADADGVELVSSDHPVTVSADIVALDVTVEGTFDDVADAVAKLRDQIPSGASLVVAR